MTLAIALLNVCFAFFCARRMVKDSGRVRRLHAECAEWRQIAESAQASLVNALEASNEWERGYYDALGKHCDVLIERERMEAEWRLNATDVAHWRDAYEDACKRLGETTEKLFESETERESAAQTEEEWRGAYYQLAFAVMADADYTFMELGQECERRLCELSHVQHMMTPLSDGSKSWARACRELDAHMKEKYHKSKQLALGLERESHENRDTDNGKQGE